MLRTQGRAQYNLVKFLEEERVPKLEVEGVGTFDIEEDKRLVLHRGGRGGHARVRKDHTRSHLGREARLKGGTEVSAPPFDLTPGRSSPAASSGLASLAL